MEVRFQLPRPRYASCPLAASAGHASPHASHRARGPVPRPPQPRHAGAHLSMDKVLPAVTRGCSAWRAKAALRRRAVALSRTCHRPPGSMGWASSSILDASRAVRPPACPRSTRLAVRRSRAARHPSRAAGVQVRRQHLAHQVRQNHRLLPPTAAFRTAAIVCGGRGAPSRFHA